MKHLVLLLVTLLTAQAGELRTPSLRAETGGGSLRALSDSAGHSLSAGPGALRLRCVGQDYAVHEDDGALTLDRLPGAKIASEAVVDGEELALSQSASGAAGGVWGLEWSLAGVARDYNIIVPGRSGVRLTRTSPRGNQRFDWPLEWEAGLVIVEGPGYGFYVYADDPDGRYKRLEVEQRADGWRLALTTVNNAPFDALTAIRSVRWRLGAYQGDWRVPARRYRDWQARTWPLTPLEKQRPAWVRDIRACVIMGLEPGTLDALAAKLDPRQTILYVPDWREQGYDRDYPSYDRVRPGLDPFLERAHQLGFRCMLHVNYFGCDPLNPLYARFEPFQVRSPWGRHDREWWLWDRADPVIKFAYINPALRDWRTLFVERMKKLCADHAVDSLHLDQTLCIFNDHNGLVDGQTMAQGNLALHRELRAALPDVALSGEGLDEVTYRDEAFCQRHLWGLHHSEGTWARAQLATAHPISSYLFRPYTAPYGYLGYTSPTHDQLFAAWQEGYRYWGVLPTLKPDAESLAGRAGFGQQLWAEIDLWQKRRLAPDLDGTWPAGVAFPLRGADGGPVTYTSDRRLLDGQRVVTRTISGQSEVRGPGRIDGWLVYDAERVFGLDPERWYAWSDQPRDLAALHVEALPAGYGVAEATDRGDHCVLRLEPTAATVARFEALLDQATCGTRHPDGAEIRAEGPLEAPDGGLFTTDGALLMAHPPWRQGAGGSAFARFTVRLPAGGSRFTSEVFMDPGAIGPDKSDGVLFGVSARAAGQPVIKAEKLATTAEPATLTLDLTPLAGGEATIELTVGPNANPRFDWARWRGVRIERQAAGRGTVELVTPQPHALALQGTRAVVTQTAGTSLRATLDLPGALVLLAKEPAPAPALPAALEGVPFAVTFLSGGQRLTAPQYAGASPATNTVGGRPLRGLSAHPPNQGRTCADYQLRLADRPQRLEAQVGLRDGSKSSGVDFIVEVNGQEVARRHVLPGAWQPLTADLSPWRGQPVLLSLVTDSAGGFDFDWAAWGEPRLVGQ